MKDLGALVKELVDHPTELEWFEFKHDTNEPSMIGERISAIANSCAMMERYDIVVKRLMDTNGKYYATDLGMRNVALGGAMGTDISSPVENVVFMELLRRGYTVMVGSFRDTEVDFTAIRDGVIEYFQVTLTMTSPETREREFRPLNGIRDNWRKTILTLDCIGLGSEEGVDVVNLYDWLLN